MIVLISIAPARLPHMSEPGSPFSSDMRPIRIGVLVQG